MIIKSRPSALGFTLVEIMIVVAILGLLCGIATPALLRAGVNARNTAFASSVRTFANAFVAYTLDNGGYPPDVTPGVFPAGMNEYLKPAQWTSETPIGGKWDWDYQQFGCKAGVSVFGPGADEEQMRKIDALLDDGNLATGCFRQRAGGFIYIIE